MTEARQTRARVIVSGRVQGVWFRGATAQRARELGVDGWVRNRADGSVEAVFEGDDASVRAAIDFVRNGPPSARVSDVAVTYESPTGTKGTKGTERTEGTKSAFSIRS